MLHAIDNTSMLDKSFEEELTCASQVSSSIVIRPVQYKVECSPYGLCKHCGISTPGKLARSLHRFPHVLQSMPAMRCSRIELLREVLSRRALTESPEKDTLIPATHQGGVFSGCHVAVE